MEQHEHKGWMLLHLGNTTYLLDVIPTETPTHSTLFKDLVGKQPPTTKSVYTTKSTMVCSSTPPCTSALNILHFLQHSPSPPPLSVLHYHLYLSLLWVSITTTSLWWAWNITKSWSCGEQWMLKNQRRTILTLGLHPSIIVNLTYSNILGNECTANTSVEVHHICC